MAKKQLKVATCQFRISTDIRKNAKQIMHQMRVAKMRNAEVAHFPETCLSGYGGVDVMSWKGFDWDLLRELCEEIAALAKELKLWVIVGSSHPLKGKHKPHNSLYVINSSGKLVTRYDKRFCTTGDLKFYSPGNHPSVFTINGVKCAALICYELRFPELYRDYQRMGVKMMFHSYHNAKGKTKKDNIHTVIMRPTMQGHAASNNMFISATNASTPHQMWPSVLIDPDGVIRKSLRQNEDGVMVNTIDLNKNYYDASGKFRKSCMDGKRNSGKLVRDARSADLTSF